MANESPLVPTFIPPLALMLGRAEQLKGNPLTEAEVIRIRDDAPCIAMEPDVAKELAATRDFRDVNPENCWGDWHRLRTQITGKGYLPKIILCLVGDAGFRETAEPVVRAAGVEHEFRGHDPHMERAFRNSAFGLADSFSEEDFANIRSHQTALYLLSKNFTAAEAPGVALAFLRLGCELLDRGAIALKCDSAGISRSHAQWAALAESAATGSPSGDLDARYAFWSPLFRAFVRYPIQNEGDLYSCGMHLLGQPDMIVATALIQKVKPPGSSDVPAVNELFNSFALYLLAECGAGEFISGHTFSVDRDSPRFGMNWEPCTGYEEHTFFFNPFGRWRFVEP
ncbi:MAG TPA: hypothetical protein VFE47_26945 [Tepidisphaeraceae bacterium]|jgi:hypothetical protein|nr:hypothetical protein [Tepidisphaeraceae bacterium]